MRPPTTMRNASARELGFDEKQRPISDIAADVEDQRGLNMLLLKCFTALAIRLRLLAAGNPFPSARWRGAEAQARL
jgi:hypothetical protein